MDFRQFEVGARRVTLLVPERTPCPLAYLHCGPEEARSAAEALAAPCALAAVDGVDWDAELSPWPAPRAFRGGRDFAGRGPDYLRELTERVVPETEARLGFAPDARWIAGYSLAGLFALYALWRTDVFSAGASASGSLWYDGFPEYLDAERPARLPRRVSLSLGDREAQTKNARLARVADCTLAARARLEALGVPTVFRWESGGHFAEEAQRTARAVGALGPDGSEEGRRRWT